MSDWTADEMNEWVNEPLAIQPISTRKMFMSERKWISVEDRLPEETGNYLIYRCLDDVLFLTDIAVFFAEDDPEWNVPLDAVDEITHWMPLPPPPATVSDETHTLTDDGPDRQRTDQR